MFAIKTYRMPTKQEIDDALDSIYEYYERGANSVPIKEAIVIINAYREECFKSLGLKEYEDEK